jgi:hypothetical protein
MPADPAVPVPGPDTPTWTIDEDGNPSITGISSRPYALTQARTGLNDAEHLALVADVRAARAHEHCGTATDTLQQAVEEIRKRRDLAVAVRVLRTERDEAPYYRGQEDAYSEALDLLVDGGGDG